jgi:segregation and condensation protein A
MARSLLGRDFFLRGAGEAPAIVARPRWDVGLYLLLRAYGDMQRRRTAQVLAIEPSRFQSMDEALRRLLPLLGRVANWRELSRFLPPAPSGEEYRRSTVAATFAAVLELARTGRVELRQDEAFGPIWLRSRAARARPAAP